MSTPVPVAAVAEPEKKKEVETIISKENAPMLLSCLSGYYDVLCFNQYKAYALMPTGSTVNAMMQMGNGDFSNTKFLLSAVSTYCGGMYLYKFLDITMKGLSGSTAAKVVFALHVIGDQLRISIPDSKFTILPLMTSGGFFNALSGGKLGGIMAMMNGQFQGLVFALATMAAKGGSADQTAATVKSLKVIAAFCFGIFSGAYSTKNMTNPVAAIANRRFTFVGALYALILVLRETPGNRLI